MPASTAITLSGADGLSSGWSEQERSRGVVFRWMSEPVAYVELTVCAPWDALRIRCAFQHHVRHDVLAEASEADVSGVAPAVGYLSAGAHGQHVQDVRLSRAVTAGRARIRFEALRWWREPGGTRRLSIALTALSVLHTVGPMQPEGSRG